MVVQNGTKLTQNGERMRWGLLLLLLIFLISLFSRDFTLFFVAVMAYIAVKALLSRRGEE
jgi:hypothetical protein